MACNMILEITAPRSYSQADGMPSSLLSEWFRHMVNCFSFRRRVAQRSGQGAVKQLHSKVSRNLLMP